MNETSHLCDPDLFVRSPVQPSTPLARTQWVSVVPRSGQSFSHGLLSPLVQDRPSGWPSTYKDRLLITAVL